MRVMEIERSVFSEVPGFHEFFRYVIPGFALGISFILLMIAYYEIALQDLFYITAVASLMSPFLGIIPFRIYYWFHQHFYRKKKEEKKNKCKVEVAFIGSDAYQKVWEIIRSHVEEAEKLKKDQADILVRCVWDKIFFKDLDQRIRERILFLFTTSHSIGATATAIFLSIGIKAIILADIIVHIDMPYQPRPIINLFTLIILFFSFAVFLYFVYRNFKTLAINEEFYAVIQNKKKIEEEKDTIEEFTETLLKKKEYN